MNNINNIDLTKYKFVQPSKIKKTKLTKKMYDLVLEKEHNFFIYLNDYTKVLSHNCDGAHITCLLTNFFQKWFPHIIDDDRLYRLVTPLVVCTYNKQRKYFYTTDEFYTFSKNHKVSDVTYLKGLGSLSEEDWSYVMDNRVLFLIKNDRGANKYLDIAFGESSQKKKNFLQKI
jgi:DNA gyrase/topoisomerase IV subunit B